VRAVDEVLLGRARRAFAAVRPPGHHLGPQGATESPELRDSDAGSQGFCLLNNVAIAAAYARCVHRARVSRIAIVDFDVHHGNGTEAIVRNCCGRPGEVKLGSFSVLGARVKTRVELPRTAQPWLDPAKDARDVAFVSSHCFGRGFYPGTGAKLYPGPVEPGGPAGGPRLLHTGQVPRIMNIALRQGASSKQFRYSYQTRVLPFLREFQPDLLFLSAGFDGHEDDLMLATRCIEADFAWVTQELCQTCPRVVSVLEGGYNTRGGLVSPFARSVQAHVRALQGAPGPAGMNLP